MMNVQPESGVKMPVSPCKSFDLLQSMPPRCFALPAGGQRLEVGGGLVCHGLLQE